MLLKFTPFLLGASIVLSLFGWGNAYVTLATNDATAYAPVLRDAFIFLGVSQLLLVVVMTRKIRMMRGIAVVLFLLNCMPIYHSLLRVPYVFV